MEENKVSKKLPEVRVYEKIKDFYLKIKKVNLLAYNYLKDNKEKSYKIFEPEWINLLDEVNIYFQALSFKDINWPHQKSILFEKECDIDVLIFDVEKEIIKSSCSKSKIKKMTISYHVENNQDDVSSKTQFPYFGMYLAFSLNDGKNNVFSIATHKTKIGCNLISPKINEKELVIIGEKKAIKFSEEEKFKVFLQSIKAAGLIAVEDEVIFVSNFVLLN